jgi:hypothetical protein
MTIKELMLLLGDYKGDRQVVIETPEGDEITEVVLGDGFNGEVVIKEF